MVVCLPFLDSDQVYHFYYQGDIHHSLPDSTFEELDLDIYREAPQVVIDDLYIEKDSELSLVPSAPPLPLSIEELDPEVEEFLGECSGRACLHWVRHRQASSTASSFGGFTTLQATKNN